ncbi:MAG TPA: S8 family serine peptidase, partial [Dehalococcoidia bacterium]|nr:S8 family serine peptidase [Dehalococcoidia bacterium]
MALVNSRRRTAGLVLLALITLLSLIFASSVGGQSPQGGRIGLARNPFLPHETDHVLVRLNFGSNASQVSPGAQFIFDRWFRVPVLPNETPSEAIQRLSRFPGVEVAELDYIASVGPTPAVPVGQEAGTAAAPDDPNFGLQWHMNAIQAPDAWELATGAGVEVAVIDTGVSRGSDWCAQIVDPYNAINNTSGANVAEDDNRHGTHVAGTIAQCTNNGVGVAGVAYGASIMPIKALDSNGSGSFSNIARGLDWARTHGARVVNMSLGMDCTSGYPDCSSSVMNTAIDDAVADGIVVVAAAGNANTSTLGYPANHPDVIAVGATRFDNARAPYSTFGAGLDVVAPGGDTSVNQNGDGYADGVLQETFELRTSGSWFRRTTTKVWGFYFFQGTSMATPHVSGVAALLFSAKSTATAAEVRDAIESTAKDLGSPGYDTTFGNGLVQAADAVQTFLGPAPPGAPQNLSATPGNGEVDLSWDPPASNRGSDITGYEITWTPSGPAQPLEVGAADTDETISGLTNGMQYTFTVKAKNDEGTSPGASTSATPRMVPDAPQNLSATPGIGKVDLSWDPPSSNGGSPITGYEITGGPTTVNVGGSTTSATINGLDGGTSYTFTVKAKNAAGTGPGASASPVTPESANVPGAPGSVSAAAGNG